MRTEAGGLQFILGDHLGSTSVMSDPSGALLNSQGYKPWGETRFGGVGIEYQYTGQYRQSAIGMDYYNARWYDPALGRFAIADSIVPEVGNSQDWDRYAYSYGNPIRYNDPTGHISTDPGGGCLENQDACIRAQILNKNDQLVKQVKSGKFTDLEGFAQLVEYAAVFTPNCVECFVQNLGSILTGISNGKSFINEIKAQLKLFEYDEYYGKASDFGQEGYAAIFQDPNTGQGGGNQAHHLWFYVQVGFESGTLMGRIGNILHESLLTRNTAGNSAQDMFLGYEGTDLGVSLENGSLSPDQVGGYIRDTLSPGSDAAIFWMEFLYHVNELPSSMY